MTNLINRLQLNLRFSKEEEAFNVRQNFAQTFQAQIEEVVDRVCSKYAGEDEWLTIDKLEMDLGRFRPNGFRHNFAGAFLFHFEKALIEKLSRITATDRETSREMLKAELLEYFLQNGTLPWYASEEEIDIEEVSLEIVKDKPEVFKSILLKNRFKKNFWKRVSYQMSDEVKSLIFDMLEELKNAEKAAISLVDDFLNDAAKQTINDAAESAITSIEKYKNEDRNSGITGKAKIFKNTRIALLEEAAEIFKAIGNLYVVREVIQKHASFIFGENSIATIAKNGFGIAKSSNNTVAPVFNQAFETAESFGNSSSKDKPGVTTKTNIAAAYQFEDIFKSSDDAEEKFVVKHAGILLLSPFFYSFFTKLQLIKGIEWVSKAAQYKAVHLLKFLSTGQVKPPEFVLTLEKIFCGLAIHEPVPAEVELSEDDLRESRELLESVIEHWKALKNTSVNGLREAFLKRDGILSRTDNGWLLRVERKTHDVLLNSIPWGYSTISLSWSPYLVFVEW